jgi:hypothetical protein
VGRATPLALLLLLLLLGCSRVWRWLAAAGAAAAGAPWLPLARAARPQPLSIIGLP